LAALQGRKTPFSSAPVQASDLTEHLAVELALLFSGPRRRITSEDIEQGHLGLLRYDL
jgi:hypothetical protein